MAWSIKGLQRMFAEITWAPKEAYRTVVWESVRDYQRLRAVTREGLERLRPLPIWDEGRESRIA